MKRLRYCLYSNVMLVCNLLTALVGIEILTAFFQIMDIESRPVYAIFQTFRRYFAPAALTFLAMGMRGYEQPLRRSLRKIIYGEKASAKLMNRARRKLLNYPYFAILIHIFIWVAAAIVFNAIMRGRGMGGYVHGLSFRLLIAGLISAALSFFLNEAVLMRLFTPIFFPQGGLSGTRGVLRVSIGVRLGILIFATCLIPLGTIYLNIERSAQVLGLGLRDPLEILERLQAVVAGETVIFTAMAIGLTYLVIFNFIRPLKEIVATLKAVHSGSYDRKVRVISNDEIGYTGEVINNMADGLKERDQMRYALDLAKEVQQSLLPRNEPRIEGLDIAGKSIYCESVGGDYYDFIYKGNPRKDKIDVIVGDVSDHGIQSALIMATARSAIHQRRCLPGGIAQVVADVNRQLAKDVETSGHFMTLFFAEIDKGADCLRWVNAGHDPAILYDPCKDTFDELAGGNPALGIDENVAFQDFRRDMAAGQILAIATDGIYESRNIEGEMFGKDKLKEIIRMKAQASAKDILASVMGAVEQFIYPLKKEDDVTLVLIKSLP